MDTHIGAIRILIADDHPIFREGLRKLLEAEPDFGVAGEARDGVEAVELTRRYMPDVLLLDLAMPGLSGLEVLGELNEELKQVRAILLVAAIEKLALLKSLQLGARGAVSKGSPTDLLFKSIRSVMAGEFWLGRDMVPDLVEGFVQGRPEEPATRKPFNLTQRELQVLRLVVDAYSNREIAQAFSLSEETVKHHVSSIFRKTGASNRVELALFAMHHRLVRAS